MQKTWTQGRKWSDNWHMEWCLWKKARHTHAYIAIERDTDNQLKFSLALWYLFAVWFSFKVPSLKYTTLETSRRELRVSFHDWTIWLTLWGDSMGWGPSRRVNLDIRELFLGRQRIFKEHMETRHFILEMPEGEYVAKVTTDRFTRIWKRFPFPFAWHTYRRIDIEVEEGVPVPGKGENSWDCGDDAIYSISYHVDKDIKSHYLQAKDIQPYLDKFQQSILATRLKHGGEDWVSTPPVETEQLKKLRHKHEVAQKYKP